MLDTDSDACWTPNPAHGGQSLTLWLDRPRRAQRRWIIPTCSGILSLLNIQEVTDAPGEGIRNLRFAPATLRKIQEVLRLKWQGGLSPHQDLRQQGDCPQLLNIPHHGERICPQSPADWPDLASA